MRNLKFKSLFTLALCSLFSLSILAQSTDDLYYTPSYNDYSVDEVADYETASAIVEEDVVDNTNYAVSDSRLDNDFFYQSRLRRFCNPVRGLSYYAPAYTNSYYYNNNPYAWSNNIYTQPYYSQRWWNPVNTYSINRFGNNGYNYNRNYTSTYTSFGSTIYNNRNYNNPYYGSTYNYNNSGGFFNPAPLDACTTTNYISNNSIDNYNESRNRSTTTRSNSSVRTVRSATPSASQSNSANKAVRSATPSSTRTDRSATRSTTRSTANKSNTNVRTERKSVVERSTTPKKERKSGIRNAFRNLGDAVGGSSKSNNSKSYRSSSGTKSYSSGTSKGSSRSSGSSRGGRQ